MVPGAGVSVVQGQCWMMQRHLRSLLILTDYRAKRPRRRDAGHHLASIPQGVTEAILNLLATERYYVMKDQPLPALPQPARDTQLPATAKLE